MIPHSLLLSNWTLVSAIPLNSVSGKRACLQQFWVSKYCEYPDNNKNAFDYFSFWPPFDCQGLPLLSAASDNWLQSSSPAECHNPAVKLVSAFGPSSPEGALSFGDLTPPKSNPEYWVANREAVGTVFGVTQPGIEPSTCQSQGRHSRTLCNTQQNHVTSNSMQKLGRTKKEVHRHWLPAWCGTLSTLVGSLTHLLVSLGNCQWHHACMYQMNTVIWKIHRLVLKYSCQSTFRGQCIQNRKR